MKKAIFIVAILFIAVFSTACINNIAVQELNNKAQLAMSKGDYDSAIQSLEASIDLDCNMYQTHYNLGVAYIEARLFDKAIISLEKSLHLNSKYPETYYSIAIAQESIADEMSATTDTKEQTDSPVKTVYSTTLTDEEKHNIVNYYNSAIENYNKYMSMTNSNTKKLEVENHIKDIEKVLEKLGY